MSTEKLAEGESNMLQERQRERETERERERESSIPQPPSKLVQCSEPVFGQAIRKNRGNMK